MGYKRKAKRSQLTNQCPPGQTMTVVFLHWWHLPQKAARSTKQHEPYKTLSTVCGTQ